ncbi:MAG TPA: hypothetical protein VFQ22_02350 [Longimicrobiales bacterium]|nr:hypothetical protein [Longimicrobiales bacterium]
MRPTRRTSALLAALALAACDERTPTAVDAAPPVPPEALALAVPNLTSADLVTTISIVDSTGADGPARVIRDPGTNPPPDPEPITSTYVRSAIYDAQTLVGFNPGSAFAWGMHHYQGNKGRIETTANVTFQGTPIGSRTAVAEQYTPVLVDFGLKHFIQVMAEVFTDRTCGLTVSGSSEHFAWWEFIGKGVLEMGRSQISSSARPKSKDPCPSSPPPPPPPPHGGGGSTDEDYGGGDSGVCYFWVRYDLNTGEVVNYRLLYCEGLGEGG